MVVLREESLPELRKEAVARGRRRSWLCCKVCQCKTETGRATVKGRTDIGFIFMAVGLLGLNFSGAVVGDATRRNREHYD